MSYFSIRFQLLSNGQGTYDKKQWEHTTKKKKKKKCEPPLMFNRCNKYSMSNQRALVSLIQCADMVWRMARLTGHEVFVVTVIWEPTKTLQIRTIIAMFYWECFSVLLLKFFSAFEKWICLNHLSSWLTKWMTFYSITWIAFRNLSQLT